MQRCLYIVSRNDREGQGMSEPTISFMNDPISYIGKSVKVFLKTGESFYLKVTKTGQQGINEYIFGFDEEGRNRRIYKHQLDYIQER